MLALRDIALDRFSSVHHRVEWEAVINLVRVRRSLKSHLGSHFDSLRPAFTNLNPSRHASGQAGEPKAKQTFKYSPGGPDLDLENRFLNPETDLLNPRKNCFMYCF